MRNAALQEEFSFIEEEEALEAAAGD